MSPLDAEAPVAEFTSLRAANIARQSEWAGGQDVSLLFRANELAGEVGEACNVVKKIERERLGMRGSRATLADLADELADVVICADLVALAEGIDLDAAVARKFNATSEKVGLGTRLAFQTAQPLVSALSHQPPRAPDEPGDRAREAGKSLPEGDA